VRILLIMFGAAMMLAVASLALAHQLSRSIRETELRTRCLLAANRA
jgi:hypothetical protein